MKQTIKHGATIDAMTPGEAQALLQAYRERDMPKRVRASRTVQLDATGAGQDEVYTVPPGWEFETRRIVLDLDLATDPNTGNVALNAAGRAVEYLRSGTRIEYGLPQGPAGAQVPGVQTWGAEQGPYLRNGEVLEVKVRGLTANAILTATVEGILKRPVSSK